MKTGSLLALIVLALIAFGHLLRLAAGVELVAAGHRLPMWPSVVAVLGCAGIAVQLWREREG